MRAQEFSEVQIKTMISVLLVASQINIKPVIRSAVDYLSQTILTSLQAIENSARGTLHLQKNH